MTIGEALDIVIDRSGIERYRFLCLEHPNDNVRAEYSDLVLRLAANPDAIGKPLKEQYLMAGRIKACPFWSISGDGCQCSRCALQGGAKTSFVECSACISQYG